jgi:short-subunit dehydrogenase
MRKTVLVTGTSSGIGKAIAIHLAQTDYKVYGAARRTEKMEELKAYGIVALAIDITKEESVRQGIRLIFEEAGSIDILVNNAGFGLEGAIEDVSINEARYQLEVNVIAAMRLARLLLPKMRQNRYGKIVNISSVGGKIAFPLGGWYHGSKFALEALSDSMRMEVKEFGVDVIVALLLRIQKAFRTDPSQAGRTSAQYKVKPRNSIDSSSPQHGWSARRPFRFFAEN